MEVIDGDDSDYETNISGNMTNIKGKKLFKMHFYSDYLHETHDLSDHLTKLPPNLAINIRNSHRNL